MGDLGWDGDYCEVPRCRRRAASIYGPSVDGRVGMRISSAEERGRTRAGARRRGHRTLPTLRTEPGHATGRAWERPCPLWVATPGCWVRWWGSPCQDRVRRGSAPAEDLPSIRGSRCTPRAALRQTIFAFQTSAFPFRLGRLHAPGASRSLARLPTRPHPPASRARAASRTDRRVCADVVVLLRTISRGQRATRQSARISTHRSRKAPPRLPSSWAGRACWQLDASRERPRREPRREINLPSRSPAV